MGKRLLKQLQNYAGYVADLQRPEYSLLVLIAMDHNVKSSKSFAQKLDDIYGQEIYFARVVELVGILRENESARKLFLERDRFLRDAFKWLDGLILLWFELVHHLGSLNLTDETKPGLGINLYSYRFDITIPRELTPEMVDIITAHPVSVQFNAGMGWKGDLQYELLKANEPYAEPCVKDEPDLPRPAAVMKDLFWWCILPVHIRGNGERGTCTLVREHFEAVFFLFCNSANDQQWEDAVAAFGQDFVDAMCTKYADAVKYPQSRFKSGSRVVSQVLDCGDVSKLYDRDTGIALPGPDGQYPVRGAVYCPRVIESLRRRGIFATYFPAHTDPTTAVADPTTAVVDPTTTVDKPTATVTDSTEPVNDPTENAAIEDPVTPLDQIYGWSFWGDATTPSSPSDSTEPVESAPDRPQPDKMNPDQPPAGSRKSREPRGMWNEEDVLYVMRKVQEIREEDDQKRLLWLIWSRSASCGTRSAPPRIRPKRR